MSFSSFQSHTVPVSSTKTELKTITEEEPSPQPSSSHEPSNQESSSTESSDGGTGTRTLVVRKRVRVQGPADPLYRIRDHIPRPATPTRYGGQSTVFTNNILLPVPFSLSATNGTGTGNDFLVPIPYRYGYLC
jgi:hypothetical protein